MGLLVKDGEKDCIPFLLKKYHNLLQSVDIIIIITSCIKRMNNLLKTIEEYLFSTLTWYIKKIYIYSLHTDTNTDTKHMQRPRKKQPKPTYLHNTPR